MRTATINAPIHRHGIDGRPLPDLQSITVTSRSRPLRADLDALGVPADAEYHCGSYDACAGVQSWHYTRPLGVTGSCRECVTLAVAVAADRMSLAEETKAMEDDIADMYREQLRALDCGATP